MDPLGIVVSDKSRRIRGDLVQALARNDGERLRDSRVGGERHVGRVDRARRERQSPLQRVTARGFAFGHHAER